MSGSKCRKPKGQLAPDQTVFVSWLPIKQCLCPLAPPTVDCVLKTLVDACFTAVCAAGGCCRCVSTVRSTEYATNLKVEMYIYIYVGRNRAAVTTADPRGGQRRTREELGGMRLSRCL